MRAVKNHDAVSIGAKTLVGDVSSGVNVRIDRVDDDVIAAADDERRLFDVFQVIPGPFALGTPLGNSSALRQCGLLAHFGIAILGTEPKALKEFASCPLAGIGWA